MKVKLQLQGQFGTNEEHLHCKLMGKKWWIHTELAEYSAAIIAAVSVFFGATANPPLLFPSGMSSKFQCNGIVYINTSSSRRWVLDVGAPKLRSRVN
jgi:hypothetical protein